MNPTELDIYKKAASSIIACFLTAREEEKTQIDLSYTTMHHGFFSNLIYGELKIVPTEDVEVAATDEFSIFFNPKKFLVNYPTVEQRCFIYCHEVVHVIRRDCSMLHKYREVHNSVVSTPDGDFPFESYASNVVLDMIINAMLKAHGVGEMPPDAQYDLDISDGTEDFATCYGRYMKRRQNDPNHKDDPNEGKPGGMGKGRSKPGGFDEHLSPGAGSGKNPDEAAADERGDLKVAVAAAAAAALQRGDMPMGLFRTINQAIAPEVPWYELIRAKMMSITNGGGYNFRSPDRRLIVRKPKAFYSPRRTGFNAGCIVVGVDTSGSMQDERTIDVIFAHLVPILEDTNPSELWLMWCDAKVHRVDEVEDVEDLHTIRSKGAPGGGGTSMNPIINEIDKLGIEPELLIIFTDLDIGPVKQPTYPVLWAATRDKPQPYGDKVFIKLR